MNRLRQKSPWLSRRRKDTPEATRRRHAQIRGFYGDFLTRMPGQSSGVPMNSMPAASNAF